MLPTATVFLDADEWDARADVTRGDQQHAARGIGGPPRPASGTGRRRRLGHLGVARQRAHRRRYPRQRHHECRHHRRPCTRGDRPARDPGRNQASADPLPGRAQRAVELLPLVPLLPQWLVRRMVGFSAGSAASVVSSNLGVVNPAAYRPDGTDADHFVMKGSRPRCDQGDHAPTRRITGVAVGEDARTGLRFGPCVSAGPSQLE